MGKSILTEMAGQRSLRRSLTGYGRNETEQKMHNRSGFREIRNFQLACETLRVPCSVDIELGSLRLKSTAQDTVTFANLARSVLL